MKTGRVLSVNVKKCVSGLSGSLPGVFIALLHYVNEANISLFLDTVISSCLTFDGAFN